MRTHPFLSRKHRVPFRRPFLIVLGQSTAFYLLLSSCFKMASYRAKWSNYVHSHISSIQGVNTTRSCAGTHALFPGIECGQPLSNRWGYLIRMLPFVTCLSYHPSLTFTIRNHHNFFVSVRSALKCSKYPFQGNNKKQHQILHPWVIPNEVTKVR